MDLLKNIPVGVDTRNDGIQFNLNLFSKGTKADYRDDFPQAIVRATGARIEIINNAFDKLLISNIYLGIILNTKVIEAFGSTYFNDFTNYISLERGSNFEIAFEGKELLKIFNQHEKERGVILIENLNYNAMSNCFDGNLIESELNRLNRDTDPEYQNWHIEGFERLDIKYSGGSIPRCLKQLQLK